MDSKHVSPTVLTVAGFDPSSGAGVTADLAVFAAHSCFGISAITALTVQSTTGVRHVQPMDAALLSETLCCLEEDLPPAGIKIGMLADEPQVAVVICYLQTLRAKGRSPFVVLDPVLQSSSGTDLLTSSGLTLLKDELLSLVDLVTPNTVELSRLTGMPCTTEPEIAAAMSALASVHPNLAVLATGGHRQTPDDVLLQHGAITVFKGVHVTTLATHGTGCAFASALLCARMHGKATEAAAGAAKAYVATAMRRAELRGSGRGPLKLLWPLLEHTAS